MQDQTIEPLIKLKKMKFIPPFSTAYPDEKLSHSQIDAHILAEAKKRYNFLTASNGANGK